MRPQYTVICRKCGKSFTASRCDARYCSKVCSASYHQNVELREQTKKYKAQHHKDNKERANKKNADYYLAHHERILQQGRQKTAQNRTIKTCILCNKDFMPINTMHQKLCSDECRTQYEAKWANNHYHSSINRKIASCMRSRLLKALKGGIKSQTTQELLGCSIPELKLHLESLFKPGMTWDNYSFTGWHIDHIIPLSSFDLSDPMQFKKACHYTNLQPLWATENLKKSNKQSYQVCQVEC